MIETLLQDLRYALRTVRLNPAFTITAVAALALGIGANTAIFSVVNTVLLKPLAYPDPDRIVQFMLIRSGAAWVGASPTKFNLWRDETRVLQDISAYRVGVVNLTGGAYPEQVAMAQVSADTFRLFGAPIEQGRTFTVEEDRPGGPHVAVISHGLWQRRFGGDDGTIGKSIALGDEPYVIIGVLGPGFDFDSDPPPDVWTPFQLDPNSTDQAHYFSAAARLKPGVTIAMANAQLQLAAEQFHLKYPNGLGTRDGFAMQPLRERMVGEVRPSLLILHRRRKPGAPHSLRQRRHPASDSRYRKKTRDRRPRGAGRQPLTHHSPTAHRERGALCHCRHARLGVGHVGRTRAARHESR